MGEAGLLQYGLILVINVYAFFTENRPGRMIAFTIGLIIILWSTYTKYNYDLNLDEYLIEKSRFCQSQNSWLYCISTHTKFEEFQSNRLKNKDNASICSSCPYRPTIVIRYRDRYNVLRESDLVTDDIEHMSSYLDANIHDARFDIGSWTSQQDLLTINPVVDGDYLVYIAQVLGDGPLKSLARFKKNCVNSGSIFVVTKASKIVSLEWLGDVNKDCFDKIWLPKLASHAEFRVDEQYRSRRIIDTVVRYYDNDDARLLIVTSRPPGSNRNHFGIRLAVISRKFANLPESYPEMPNLAFFRAIENIAQK